MSRKRSTIALLLTSVVAANAAPQDEVLPDTDAYLAGLKYRMVGPHRGGRVTTVTGVVGKPHTFYFGSTGGGV